MSVPSPFDEGGDDSPALDIASAPDKTPLAAVESEPAPKVERTETKADDKPADDYQSKYNNMRGALREERAEKARQREELESLRAQLEQFKHLREEFDAHRKAKREQEEAERFQQDPAGYLKEQVDKIAARTQEIAQKTERETAEQAEQNRFLAAVSSKVQEFQRENPDYNDALEFAYNKRMREYEIMGIPAHERNETFSNESLNLSYMAMRQGVNPAERVYNLAKEWGYRKKAEIDPSLTENPSAAHAKTMEQIDRLSNGQFAAKTLSKPGSTGEESMLQKIEDMDDDEFDKYFSSLDPKKSRR